MTTHRAPPEATIELISRPDHVTARLFGEADVASERALRTALDTALNTALDTSRLELDVSGLTFCDVRGLSVLIDTLAAGRRAGLSVTVSGADTGLRRMWQLVEPGEFLDQAGQFV